jgi:hypothetical protein
MVEQFQYRFGIPSVRVKSGNEEVVTGKTGIILGYEKRISNSNYLEAIRDIKAPECNRMGHCHAREFVHSQYRLLEK